jgi:hypothetical protein
VGNGAPFFARAFQEDFAPGVDVVSDPELEVYRILAFEKGLHAIANPKTTLHSVRAGLAGFRQTKTQGTADQLGGVIVLSPGNEARYFYRSRVAGDHPDPEEVLAALP